MADLRSELTSILHQAAQKLNLVKYTFDLNLDANRGDGFMGDLYKVSITDCSNNTKIDLVLKKAPTHPKRRQNNFIEELYKNEILFYSRLVPALQNLEEEHQVSKRFDKIAEYVTSVGTPGGEVIVLKDVTSDGFILREKDLLFDDQHVKLIFETYGHFHGLNFCLKKQKPEEFQEVAKAVFDNFLALSTKETFKTVLAGTMSHFSVENEEFRKYFEKPLDVFSEALRYEGSFTCMLHGDCWSNNMMYKYQDSNHSLVDLKLIDFQLIRVGTPVYDLSYFFYTGGSKELFDKLEFYLDIYYESFTRSVKELGEEPQKLLPRNILTADWKKYAKFGAILAILVTKIKLISKEDTIDLAENSYKEEKKKEEGTSKFMSVKFDEEVFKKRVSDILMHMQEIDAL